MIRALVALTTLLLLSACGGGGSGSSTPASTSVTPPTTLSNFATVTVDAGPPALDVGPNAYIQANVAYVSVTLCAPGTPNCQTIDHVQVDTGSVGLRIAEGVLSPTLLAALPQQEDSAGNPVGECYSFVDGYVFGSVRQADFQIGGETVSNMPLTVLGDAGAFSTPPRSCSAGGGANLDTVQNFGANGIIGIGVTTTDCGIACTTAGGYSSAIYYDCPSLGCGSIIARASSAAAPFQQLPNPVAAMATDNNGSILSVPAPPAAGEATLTGTLYFGIGTQTNNGLGAASVVPATNSSDPTGPGLVTAVYNGQTLNESTVDSGSNFLIFVDSTITPCSQAADIGYYCPASPLTLTPTLQGVAGAMIAATVMLNNAATLLSTTYAVLPGLGGNPDVFSAINPYPNSFDFGLPFFFGRNVYTAIEGRNAGGTMGPYFAF